MTDSRTVGAYGLHLHEREGASILTEPVRSRLVPAEGHWPRWEVFRAEPYEDDPPTEEWGSQRALLHAQPAGLIELDRTEARTTFRVPGPFAPEAFLHPQLASTAAIAGHWLGRSTFHGGAFALDGRVWGLIGDREMGKSSTLMGLHVQNIPIVADDVIVVLRGETAYSGPRCLDLRRSAAERFEAGRPLGRVGRRERWRVDLPETSGEWRFAGWVLLGWAPDVVVEELDAAQRLRVLVTNRAVTAAGASPPGLLDAAARPMVLFGRPKEWSCLNSGLRRLLDALAAYS